jgi:hypothetical protein
MVLVRCKDLKVLLDQFAEPDPEEIQRDMRTRHARYLLSGKKAWGPW